MPLSDAAKKIISPKTAKKKVYKRRYMTPTWLKKMSQCSKKKKFKTGMWLEGGVKRLPYRLTPRGAAEMSFRVRAGHDAHVIFGVRRKDIFQVDDPKAYIIQVVFGGWGNNFTAIRGCASCGGGFTMSPTPNLLSPTEERHLWISIEPRPGGQAVVAGMVTKEGERVKLVEKALHRYLPIKHVGVATDMSSEGIFSKICFTGKACDRRRISLGPDLKYQVLPLLFNSPGEGTIHLQARAESNFFVALAAKRTDFNNTLASMYEIAFALNGRTVSVRTCRSCPEILTAQRRNLTHPVKYSHLYIKLEELVEGQKIEVGVYKKNKRPKKSQTRGAKDKKVVPFEEETKEVILSGLMKNFLPVMHVGVSTGYGISGQVYGACLSSKPSDHSTAKEKACAQALDLDGRATNLTLVRGRMTGSGYAFITFEARAHGNIRVGLGRTKSELTSGSPSSYELLLASFGGVLWTVRKCQGCQDTEQQRWLTAPNPFQYTRYFIQALPYKGAQVIRAGFVKEDGTLQTVVSRTFSFVRSLRYMGLAALPGTAVSFRNICLHATKCQKRLVGTAKGMIQWVKHKLPMTGAGEVHVWAKAAKANLVITLADRKASSRNAAVSMVQVVLGSGPQLDKLGIRACPSCAFMAEYEMVVEPVDSMTGDFQQYVVSVEPSEGGQLVTVYFIKKDTRYELGKYRFPYYLRVRHIGVGTGSDAPALFKKLCVGMSDSITKLRVKNKPGSCFLNTAFESDKLSLIRQRFRRTDMGTLSFLAKGYNNLRLALLPTGVKPSDEEARAYHVTIGARGNKETRVAPCRECEDKAVVRKNEWPLIASRYVRYTVRLRTEEKGQNMTIKLADKMDARSPRTLISTFFADAIPARRVAFALSNGIRIKNICVDKPSCRAYLVAEGAVNPARVNVSTPGEGVFKVWVRGTDAVIVLAPQNSTNAFRVSIAGRTVNITGPGAVSEGADLKDELLSDSELRQLILRLSITPKGQELRVNVPAKGGEKEVAALFYEGVLPVTTARVGGGRKYFPVEFRDFCAQAPKSKTPLEVADDDSEERLNEKPDTSPADPKIEDIPEEDATPKPVAMPRTVTKRKPEKEVIVPVLRIVPPKPEPPKIERSPEEERALREAREEAEEAKRLAAEHARRKAEREKAAREEAAQKEAQEAARAAQEAEDRRRDVRVAIPGRPFNPNSRSIKWHDKRARAKQYKPWHDFRVPKRHAPLETVLKDIKEDLKGVPAPTAESAQQQ